MLGTLEALGVCHGWSYESRAKQQGRRTLSRPGVKWTFIDIAKQAKPDFVGNAFNPDNLSRWLGGRQFDLIMFEWCGQWTYYDGFAMFAPYLRRPGGILAIRGISDRLWGYSRQEASGSDAWRFLSGTESEHHGRRPVDPLAWLIHQARALGAAVVRPLSGRWSEIDLRCRGLLSSGQDPDTTLVFETLPQPTASRPAPPPPRVTRDLQRTGVRCEVRAFEADGLVIYPSVDVGSDSVALRWEALDPNTDAETYARLPKLLTVAARRESTGGLVMVLTTGLAPTDTTLLQLFSDRDDALFGRSMRFAVGQLLARSPFGWQPSSAVTVLLDVRSLWTDADNRNQEVDDPERLETTPFQELRDGAETALTAPGSKYAYLLPSTASPAILKYRTTLQRFLAHTVLASQLAC
jgi:hypothetical protein